MAVILLQEGAAILDHQAWLTQLLDKHDFHSHDKRPLAFQGLFDIRTRFLMDGQARKIADQLEENGEETFEPKRKKKKKEASAEDSLRNTAESVLVRNAFTALQSTSEFKATFGYTPTPQDYRTNNIELRNLRMRLMKASDITLPKCDGVAAGPGFTTRVMGGAKYLLPPHSRFICDDVANILDHTTDEKFDFIVMDPPWHNKHVRRKKHANESQWYNMMGVEDILKVPVDRLLRDGGVVAVWSTNRHSQTQHFLHGLHAWGLHHVATWYWLKVTKAGEPITPIGSNCHGKLPYERIFIARKRNTKTCPENIPDNFVLCSVPSGIHSHKPPLFDLMKTFLVSQPRCLELFARSLVPGWTSIGLEVLRLQHGDLFERLDD